MHASNGKVRIKNELDASIIWNNYMVSTAPAVGLPVETLPFFSLSYALGNLLASFAEPQFVTDTITLPPESCNEALKIYSDLADWAERFGVNVVSGHTGCYEGIDMPIITVTAFGNRLRPLGMPSKGDLVLLIGEPLMESRWLKWLAGLSEEKIEWMDLTPLHALRDILKINSIKLAHDVSEGGIGGALVEIQERFGLNVSLLDSRFSGMLSEPSYGTVLAVTDMASKNEVCIELERLGHSCQVIAEIGGKEPLKVTDRGYTWNIYGKPASTFDITMNRFSLFLKDLSAIDFRSIIPEVGMNIAYSKGTSEPEKILGIDGRITKGLNGVIIGKPRYGASKHVGYILSELQKRGVKYSVATNIKLSDKIISSLNRFNMKINTVNINDPYCPPLRFIKERGIIADAYVEAPSKGLEGGIVILADDLEKMLKLIKGLCQ